jgi:hypothetical protein
VANNQQWISKSSYPLSFSEFTTSTETPEYLAEAFITDYERPADPTQPARQTQARYWWDNLSGTGTINPGGGSDGGGGTTDPNPPPATNKNKQIISMLLTDTLNGWKW